MRTRPVVLASLVALTSSLASHGHAASAEPRYRVWDVVRSQAGPTQLTIELASGFHESRVLLAAAYMRVTNGRRVTLPGSYLASDEGSTLPQTYGAGQSLSCTGDVCASSPRSGYDLATLYYSDNGVPATDAANSVLVVTYGRAPSIRVTADGAQWRVREVRRRVRAVWTTDGQGGAGVYQQRAGAEAFDVVTAPGGSKGSVAIAAPPCSGTVTVAAGAGTATLSGGDVPASVVCPTSTTRASSSASRSTVWSFSGPVVGVTTKLAPEPGPVRLLVVDY